MISDAKPDFYQILGVSQGAEDVVIRAAYRALVQRYHPDKVSAKERPNAQVRIQAIQEAYRVLSDPLSRSEFDRSYPVRSRKKGLVTLQSAWEMPNPRFANPLDDQSWEALLHFHPQLNGHFSRLAQTDPEMAREYKTFLTELVAEKVLAKVVKRVSKEAEAQEAQIKEVFNKRAPANKVGSRRLKKPT
jgi:DnaJ-class molecular chaperone